MPAPADESPRLAEIVALKTASDLVAAPVPTPGVNASALGAANGPGLQNALHALLGRPLGPELLANVKAAITAHYVAIGRPYIEVGFPQQDVTDGVLQVVVTEFRIGKIEVAGNTWFSSRQIARRAALEAGQTVDQATLDRRLLQINGGPFLQVTPEFKAGATPGTTDVVLRAEDRFPVRVTAGYDNSGALSTGFDRWQLGATWGNAFWQGHTVNYSFTSSTDFYNRRVSEDGRTADPSFQSHSAGWQIPLPWGDTVTIAGVYTTQSPNLGPDLGSVGLTETIGIQYLTPLAGVSLGSFVAPGTQALSVGYDFKRTNNDLSFGGVSISRGFQDVSQFFVRHDVRVPDPYGQTSLQNTIVVSPGSMTADNTDAAFQGTGAGQSGTLGARARYAYDRLTLSRLTPLPRNLGLLLRGTGQISSETLLPIEQLPLAGIDTVRGYQEGSITASAGFTASAELSSPVFSPTFGLLGPSFTDSAQVHVFYDYGQGFNRAPSQNNPPKVHTSSTGVGGHYEIGQNLTFRIEQGWQLKNELRQAAKGAFAHVSLQVAW